MNQNLLLSEAIASIWHRLPELTGPRWPELRRRLWPLLRRMETAAGPQAGRDVLALLATEPAAYEALTEAYSELAGTRDKARGPAAPMIRRQRYTMVPVLYATDRRDTGSAKPADAFGGARSPGGELHFGEVEVSIPDDHRMGQLEAPAMWTLGFGASPTKHVLVLAIHRMSDSEFFGRSASQLRTAGAKEILLFIHGYNVSFEDAARRTAQVAYDLHFQGVPMLYSWPSEADEKRYTVDEANVGWTRPHFHAFLARVLTEPQAARVHVLAHSMGSRVLAECLQTFDPRALPAGAAALRQIVFAAPDIDSDTFRHLARAFRGRAERFTLYASSKDKALAASQLIHKYPRAGDSGDGLVVAEPLDTIEASKLDTGFLSHSYFGEHRSVISDLMGVINEGRGPEERDHLVEAAHPAGRYWLFEPAAKGGQP